ncbi:amidohydrolase [Bordetella sp. BOR01]|uniref:amidohydrolase family protein n=1 Tax=Bordetella sp. BOR01 TaxID=2854779 RepID=UPI001C4566AE|nr:amidohydrolase family protein [Bordetella sp. BOR01]MBV7483213.1 amidohydrolase family protein [Bordetella sp. BOR01]
MIGSFDEAWLGLVQEDVLDPALPIVDPHHHLWQHGRRYLLDELLADLADGHRVVATVFCQSEYGYLAEGPQALRPVGETALMAGLAEQARRQGVRTQVCAGILGYADLQLGDAVLPVLQAHIEAAAGRFRGVRHVAARHDAFSVRMAYQPAAALLADPMFRKGLAQLQALGLVFEAWVYHPQLAEVLALARAMPGLAIVLNHCGGPLAAGPYRGKRAEVFPVWRDAMRQLAACPNVVVKLGGLGMPIGGFDFHKQPRPPTSQELVDAWRPYMEPCLEDFGASRCMFESNFPVDKAMLGYRVLWNAYKKLAAGTSSADRAGLFHQTAARVYRLNLPRAGQ